MNELLEKLLKMAQKWEVQTGYDYCNGASSARQDCVNELNDFVLGLRKEVKMDYLDRIQEIEIEPPDLDYDAWREHVVEQDNLEVEPILLQLQWNRKVTIMNYQELANQFIKQHEGIGYQSQPQMVAVRAFAEWLAQQETSQQSERFCSCERPHHATSHPNICLSCGKHRRIEPHDLDYDAWREHVVEQDNLEVEPILLQPGQVVTYPRVPMTFGG